MMLRWFKRIILGVLLLVLASLASISALVATEEGSRWVIGKIVQWLPESVGRLELGDIQGNLLTGLDVSYFDFQQRRNGNLNQRYRAEEVSFRWQPLALLYSAVSVQSLQGKNITVILPPPSDQPRPDPFVWPSFALPVRIELGDVELQEIHIQQGERPITYLESVSGSLSLGTFNLRLTEFAVVAPRFGVETTGRIGLRFPYAASLFVDWHYEVPATAATATTTAITPDNAAANALEQNAVAENTYAEMVVEKNRQEDNTDIDISTNQSTSDNPPRYFFSGAGEIRGDINELDIEHKLATPFVIASKGTLLPNLVREDNEPQQSPYAEVENEWQEQTLLAQWFPANQLPPTTSATLDVSGWYNDYHALLEGEIKREGIGDFSVSADVRGNLQRVDIANLLIQQIRLEKNALVPEEVQLKTSGQVSWLPEVRWDLDVEADQFNPAFYLAEWPGNLSLDATVKGSYLRRDGAAKKSLAVSVEALKLAGQLRGLDASGSGDLGFDGLRWHSQQLRLTFGANQLNVSGSYSEQIDVQWQLDAPLLTQIDPRITGSLSTRGHLQGTFAEPRVEATARGTDLQWQGYALDDLDLNLQRAANNYTLALTAKHLHLNQQHLEQITVQGSGGLARHQLQASISSEDHGEVEFDIQSGYQDKQWRGKFNTLEIDHKKIPRWWLTSSEWITVDTTQAIIGKQCFTTRVNWRNRNNTEGATNPDATSSVAGDANSSAVSENSNATNAATDSGEVAETPQLCIDGQWNAQSGVLAKANLQAAPLRQARAWLKPDVTLGGVIDGDLSFRLDTTIPNKTSAFSGMTAKLQLQTRDGNLRYQYAGEEPNVYVWQSAQLQADLQGEQLDAGFVMDWAEYGDIRATAQLDFGRQDITGELIANFGNLAPLEALIPFADDVQGRLAADVRVTGPLQQPQVVGEMTLVDGSAKLPRFGVELMAVGAKLESQAGGRIALRTTAKSGPGQVVITGDLVDPGAADWQLKGTLSGDNFQVLNQPQLKANVTPNVTLTASSREIRLEGDTVIPYARADVKTLPPSATRVSKDVVIIDDENGDDTAVVGIPVFMNLNLELGKDVHFVGFGLDSKLIGKINILQSPPRALLTTGYVSVVDGQYKAYGQELEIERGRLLFQGPYDNPGLDISALRKTPEYEVILEIGGTLQQPSSRVRPVEGLSESQSMALLLTGKPLAEASAADAYMLISAVSGLGMDKGPAITEEIARTFHLDELTIKSDDGFEQSSLWVGKYLSPRLFVRYVVGLFDQAFSIGVQYQMTDRLRLEAESGEAQSIDIIYKIER